MREKILGLMVPLGHDKSVLSDIIVAVEPIPASKFFNVDSDGHKLRSRVLINHAEGEILASRTAGTILKSMTRQDEPGSTVTPREALENMRRLVNSNKPSPFVDIGEGDIVRKCLLENSTIKSAIEASPFGHTKFYELIKKHDIDKKAYLESTDDPEAYHDQRKDEGLV